MKAVTVSQLRADMKKHLDEVSNSSEIIIVSRSKDNEAVVIISLKEFNSMNETSHLLSSEKNRKRLKESIAQVEVNKTKYFNLDDFERSEGKDGI